MARGHSIRSARASQGPMRRTTAAKSARVIVRRAITAGSQDRRPKASCGARKIRGRTQDGRRARGPWQHIGHRKNDQLGLLSSVRQHTWPARRGLHLIQRNIGHLGGGLLRVPPHRVTHPVRRRQAHAENGHSHATGRTKLRLMSSRTGATSPAAHRTDLGLLDRVGKESIARSRRPSWQL